MVTPAAAATPASSSSERRPCSRYGGAIRARSRTASSLAASHASPAVSPRPCSARSRRSPSSGSSPASPRWTITKRAPASAATSIERRVNRTARARSASSVAARFRSRFHAPDARRSSGAGACTLVNGSAPATIARTWSASIEALASMPSKPSSAARATKAGRSRSKRSCTAHIELRAMSGRLVVSAGGVMWSRRAAAAPRSARRGHRADGRAPRRTGRCPAARRRA